MALLPRAGPPVFFEAKDPQGFLISLTKRTWFGHVLATDERAYRTGRFTREHIKATIQQADHVRQNQKSQRLNRVYFKRWVGADPLNQYLRVTAHVNDVEGKRGVVTSVVPYAYIPPVNRAYGEEIVWPK